MPICQNVEDRNFDKPVAYDVQRVVVATASASHAPVVAAVKLFQEARGLLPPSVQEYLLLVRIALPL